jgi:hypothetical protein
MLSAYDREGDLVISWDVSRDEGPFFCPECQRPVTLKKGQFIMHHFAHAPGSNCTYGTGESWEHWRAKFEIYNALRSHPGVSSLQVELPLGQVRPDISFYWEKKVHVSIELQRSTLPPTSVARRTSIYDEKNIAVLWVSLPRDRFWPGVRCSTRIWERYLHELYDGKIFCWHGGQELYATHLNPYVLRKEHRECFDKHSGIWREKEISHLSKRLRVPSYDGVVRITDMKIIEVLPQQRGLFTLPKAKLWSL